VCGPECPGDGRADSVVVTDRGEQYKIQIVKFAAATAGRPNIGTIVYNYSSVY